MSFAGLTSEGGAFRLPGGYLDEGGACHREVRVRPLRGRDEEWLFAQPRSARYPALVTELLARCVRNIGPRRATREAIRSLSVPDRDYLMLALRRVTFGERLALILVCANPACEAKMDVDLPIDEIPVAPAAPERAYRATLPGPDPIEVEFRLPRGGDQEALGEAGASAEDAASRLLAACVLSLGGERDVGPEGLAGLPAASREALEAEIARRLPQLELDMEATCPECGTSFSAPLEPASLVVDEVLRGRASFEREIHALAFHYHWPLRELLGLTRPRRQRCLRWLLEELEARAG